MFAVYFVKLLSSAVCAAAMMCGGVGKSGSPAPEIDDVHALPAQPLGFDRPLHRRGQRDVARAFGEGHRVGAHTFSVLPARAAAGQPGRHRRRHEPATEPPSARDFLDQRRAHVAPLGRRAS